VEWRGEGIEEEQKKTEVPPQKNEEEKMKQGER
jgi:hypothetical protein